MFLNILPFKLFSWTCELRFWQTRRRFFFQIRKIFFQRHFLFSSKLFYWHVECILTTQLKFVQQTPRRFRSWSEKNDRKKRFQKSIPPPPKKKLPCELVDCGFDNLAWNVSNTMLKTFSSMSENETRSFFLETVYAINISRDVENAVLTSSPKICRDETKTILLNVPNWWRSKFNINGKTIVLQNVPL